MLQSTLFQSYHGGSSHLHVFPGAKLHMVQEIFSVFVIIKTTKGNEKVLVTEQPTFPPFPTVLLQNFSHSVSETQDFVLTHSHTMTPFDAPWKQAF